MEHNTNRKGGHTIKHCCVLCNTGWSGSLFRLASSAKLTEVSEPQMIHNVLYCKHKAQGLVRVSDCSDTALVHKVHLQKQRYKNNMRTPAARYGLVAEGGGRGVDSRLSQFAPNI